MFHLINFSARATGVAFLLSFIIISSQGCKSGNRQTDEDGLTGNPVIDRLTDSIKAAPENVGLYLRRAQVFYDQQAYDQAIADLANVMKLDSINLRAHHLLADVYLDHLQSSLALQTLERASRLYPDSIPTKLKLTEFQLILKQYGAAMNTLADIMKIHPGDPEALFMLGMVYRDQGKTEQAIGAFQSAVERNPDNAEAWVILGDLMDRTHNPLAIQYFDNAIRVAPKNVATWHAKAYFLQNNDKIPEALEIYRHIHSLDPQYAEAYLNAAILLMYHDSLDAASKELDILQKIDPTNAAAWFYKGKLHQLRGENDQAKASYEQALRLDDKYEQAIDALEELKE
ncbi:MAG TPA: tetratricopeptide repeat protein [Saprospiraceae bacterium]|nr:tetratricopeptide repeat protein [Saprospiraceae bacterium]